MALSWPQPSIFDQEEITPSTVDEDARQPFVVWPSTTLFGPFNAEEEYVAPKVDEDYWRSGSRQVSTNPKPVFGEDSDFVSAHVVEEDYWLSSAVWPVTSPKPIVVNDDTDFVSLPFEEDTPSIAKQRN